MNLNVIAFWTLLEKIKMQCKALVFLIFSYFMARTLKPCSHQMNDFFVVPFPDGDQLLPDCWWSKSQTSYKSQGSCRMKVQQTYMRALSGWKMFKTLRCSHVSSETVLRTSRKPWNIHKISLRPSNDAKNLKKKRRLSLEHSMMLLHLSFSLGNEMYNSQGNTHF